MNPNRKRPSGADVRSREPRSNTKLIKPERVTCFATGVGGCDPRGSVRHYRWTEHPGPGYVAKRRKVGRSMNAVVAVFGLGGLAVWGMYGGTERRSLPEAPSLLSLGAEDGTIYYQEVITDVQFGAVRADGGVLQRFPEGVGGEPSYLLHAGRAWFLSIRELPEGTYPNKCARREVFAACESQVVQLSSDPSFEPWQVRWVPGSGDTLISWSGRRWGDGQIVGGGIYIARVVFDNAEGGLRAVDVPTSPSIPFRMTSDPFDPESPHKVLDLCDYDWSPDAVSLVYQSPDGQILTRRADGTGEPVLVFRGPASHPVWSPDGRRIAFRSQQVFSDIVTVRPDGRDVRILATSQTVLTFAGYPIWSPDGRYLAFFQAGNGRPREPDEPCSMDIVVVEPDSGRRTVVTAHIDEQVVPVAWRASRYGA